MVDKWEGHIVPVYAMTPFKVFLGFIVQVKARRVVCVNRMDTIVSSLRYDDFEVLPIQSNL
ncbi:hypothetical protein GOP47_0014427 [Adiantum capillus-veneris]|uniref:Uncharacterized protein n=1 Tax=Adiantum capillus-veneris TaxID=13818 RepID=A0A9D4ULG3_ADICA|nr:hypothetical protein GOP47_0014427 [Adiantum capillus-veneris]